MYSYRLQVFQAVATTGSFSRAAREILHISQPAVSNHVHALEEELGVLLLERVGKRGLCRKFCVGGREEAVAPVCGGITRPGTRTVRPQCGPLLRLPPSSVVS